MKRSQDGHVITSRGCQRIPARAFARSTRFNATALVATVVLALVLPATAAATCTDPLELSKFFATSVPGQPPANGHNFLCDYDRFAWQSFVALNWPAITPTKSNNYRRGFPDGTKTFTSENDPELTVWQTWKAKREIFTTGTNGKDSNQRPAGWNAQINYGPGVSNGSFTICSDAADPAAVRQALDGALHSFSMGSKISSIGVDENIEVKGEAFFPTSIRGDKSEPQVYQTSSGNPVLFDVKVNYDWFNYVLSNGYYDGKTKSAAIQGGLVNFPARTNAYKPCDFKGQFPCPTGVIATKSAWLLADDQADTSKYHTTQALYFKADNNGTLDLCADVGTFLMTGLHIIQKTENQPFFIYATFGHLDNGKGNNEFSYQNRYKNKQKQVSFLPKEGIGVGYITTTGTAQNGSPIYGPSRIPRHTQQMNQSVQAQIRAANRNSVWQNYQLVGVQFATRNADATSGNYPIGSNDPGGVGQSYYLANLTLETNWGLQNFQGQPPKIQPINAFDGLIPRRCQNLKHYDRGCPNTYNSYAGGVFNTGGCMGCHAVAQQLGTDFSFAFAGSGEIDPAPAPRPLYCQGVRCSADQKCTTSGCCDAAQTCGDTCCPAGDDCVNSMCRSHCQPAGYLCYLNDNCCSNNCATASQRFGYGYCVGN